MSLLANDLIEKIMKVSESNSLLGESTTFYEEKLFEEPVITSLPRGLFITESEISEIDVSEETKALIKTLKEEAEALKELF